MFLGPYYYEFLNAFPSLTMTSIYFVGFLFVVFLFARFYRSILRPFVLLIANVIFIVSFSKEAFMYIFIIALASYLFGFVLDKYKSKGVITGIITLYVLILLYFKYAGLFTTESIIMPLGLSFYSFKVMSYLFDVYYEKMETEKNILYFLNYVFFFPTLIAGPIHRSKAFFEELRNKPEFDYKEAKGGAVQVFLGIFEKLVFTDFIALIVSLIFDNPELMGMNRLFGVILYSFQIYLDFDAISNIAIGSARVLGFKLTKNFNSPYLAHNLKEFWHRWHISLSTWFKDYLYIPLGGSRKGNFRKYINLMIVFVVSGLWHGSTVNFLVWGFLHGLIQIIEDSVFSRFNTQDWSKWIKGCLKGIGIVVNFIIVSFLWLIFRYDNMTEVISVINSILQPQSFDYELIGITLAECYWLATILITVLVLDICRNYTDMIVLFNRLYFPIRWAIYALLIILFLIFGVYGGSFDASDFIYQFF
ncbi:MAG: MBOAT family O-acyltransferase [Erysipelotrichaceae bacterium]